jgi:hypothetical protein
LVADLYHFLDLPEDSPAQHAVWQGTWATVCGRQQPETPAPPG